jgi:hypothetical protein
MANSILAGRSCGAGHFQIRSADTVTSPSGVCTLKVRLSVPTLETRNGSTAGNISFLDSSFSARRS